MYELKLDLISTTALAVVLAIVFVSILPAIVGVLRARMTTQR